MSRHESERTMALRHRSICTGSLARRSTDALLLRHRSICTGSFVGNTVALIDAASATAASEISAAAAIAAAPAPPPRSDDRWDLDADLMRRGVGALFRNRLDECERILLEGMGLPPPPPAPPHPRSAGGGVRDVRGSFAFLYAMVSAMQGVATLANDQFAECEARLRRADAIASEERGDWAGKKLVRGVCVLDVGVVQIMQRKFLRGVCNVLRSWQWIRCLQAEALNYDGREREVVRSAALLVLGIFYIVISLLPPVSMTVASWLSGFPGDRSQGLGFLRLCWEERGLFAPWAANALIVFSVDTKTFLDERLTRSEEADLAQVVEWALTEYPGSLFFTSWISDYVAVTSRDVATARSLLEREEQEMAKLPAMLWVLNFRRGVYYMTEFRWHKAGLAFQASMGVYVAAKRRSMVPFMCAFTFLTMRQSEVEGVEVESSRAHVRDSLHLLERYRAMPKKDWGRQDTWAFDLYKQYLEEEKECVIAGTKKREKKSRRRRATHWPLLELVEIMVLYVRCVWWMALQDLERLLVKLDEEEKTRLRGEVCTAGDRVRVLMCKIGIYWHLRRPVEALKLLSAAELLESRLNKLDTHYGAMAVIDYYAALIHRDNGDVGAAKHYIRRLKSRGTSYHFHALLLLKVVTLSKDIG